MSFSMTEVYRLQQIGGSVLRNYEQLVQRADRAQHGSPALEELGAFKQAWLAGSQTPESSMCSPAVPSRPRRCGRAKHEGPRHELALTRVGAQAVDHRSGMGAEAHRAEAPPRGDGAVQFSQGAG
jgi:hypothetical protein